MTQKARTDIATAADGVGANDIAADESRGVGNLFGRLNLRQVRELVERTRDWPDESVVDLNNTDGGSTLMVLRPEKASPTPGLETTPERPAVAKGTGGTGHQDLALRLAKVLKREGDRESTLQFYEQRYWLPIAERLLGDTELLDAVVTYRQPPRTDPRPVAFVVVREEHGVMDDMVIFDSLTSANTAEGIATGYAAPGEKYTVYALTDPDEEPTP